MSIVELYLPPEAKVLGALRDRSNPWTLDQDMLAIELPGKIFLTVGWHPDLDPNGEYRIAVFQGSPDRPLKGKFRSRDVLKVEAKLYDLVKKHLPGVSARGSGGTTISLAVDEHLDSTPVDIIDPSNKSRTSDLETMV